MNSVLFRCVLAALWTGVALAQSAGDRVLTFRYTESPAYMQEVFNSVRAMADLNDAVLDRSARTITLRGPANLVTVGEWVFQELDRPARPDGAGSDVHEFRPAGMGDQMISVYFLSHIATPQSMQESVNATRAISGMQRVLPNMGGHAIAMRGTTAEVGAGRWLFQELDAQSPAIGNELAVHRGPSVGSGGETSRVFFLRNIHNPQAIMQAVNAVRSVADVQRFFPFNETFEITMRGSESQAELCEWLLARLDTPSRAAIGEYHFTGDDGLVRVFVPEGASTPEKLQDLVNHIRERSQAKRVFPYVAGSAVVFRGTPSQVAIAEAVVNQK
jgi:hypothetical protein